MKHVFNIVRTRFWTAISSEAFIFLLDYLICPCNSVKNRINYTILPPVDHFGQIPRFANKNANITSMDAIKRVKLSGENRYKQSERHTKALSYSPAFESRQWHFKQLRRKE